MSRARSHDRLVRKLQDALGEAICGALEDPLVVEIMLNPDGRLFVERLGQGVGPIGELAPGAAEIIIGSVAHALQTEVDASQPIISGELPIGGHRFEGLLPPIVAAPTFTIRRRASRLIPLEEYVRAGIMTHRQATVLRSAVASRMNIVISGGTGSGKTTLANAVIAEIVARSPDDRLVILEDTAEIQCAAENAVALHTSDTVDMARLLKSTMRLRPDRIIVGEVRDLLVLPHHRVDILIHIDTEQPSVPLGVGGEVHPEHLAQTPGTELQQQLLPDSLELRPARRQMASQKKIIDVDGEHDDVPTQSAIESAQQLRQKTGQNVFLTLDKEGICPITSQEPIVIPCPPVTGPVDIVGAGDSVTAGIVSSLAAGANAIEAGIIGNLVASVTIRQLGTTGTASPQQVMKAWQEHESIYREISS